MSDPEDLPPSGEDDEPAAAVPARATRATPLDPEGAPPDEELMAYPGAAAQALG